MQLARAAAARTPSDPATVPHANPAPRRAAANVARWYTYKPTDPAVLFTRLAATVRDCVALEARLAAGPGGTSRAVTLQLRADPRRAPVREASATPSKTTPTAPSSNANPPPASTKPSPMTPTKPSVSA